MGAINETYAPLREPTYFILLSLRAGSKHGYAILKEVETFSEGRIQLSAGTLYEALARLLDLGWVVRAEGGTDTEEETRPGKPRKTYHLTRQGHRALEAEIERLESLLTAAQRGRPAVQGDL